MWALSRHKMLAALVVMVAALAHHCYADVIIMAANQSITMFLDAPARFGPPIPLEGFKGLAVEVSPPYACQVPARVNSTRSWIAVVKRYNCSFIDKVLNVQQAGYSAVIVYNIGSDSLLPMGTDSASKAAEVAIPSVFVGYHDGYAIVKHYLYNKGRFEVVLTDDLPFNLENYLVPFAITIGICFIVMLAFMIVKCVRDYRRSRRHRLSSRALKKLPTHKFKKGDPYECCAICLEDYVDNDKLRVLPCEHAYHSKCIDPWLTKNRRVCPVCKRKVFTGDERPSDLETDSEDENSPLINSEGGTQGGTFISQRENPFQEAERQAEERRQNSRQRRRRVSRNVECGPEGYQRLAESSTDEEEEEEEEEDEEEQQREGDCQGKSTSPSSRQDAESPPVGGSHSGSPSNAPPGPVQIAVDVVNSTAPSTPTAAQNPPQQPSEDGRSDRDYVV